MRGDPRTIDDQGACDSEEDDYENWMPAPSDADPGRLMILLVFKPALNYYGSNQSRLLNFSLHV